MQFELVAPTNIPTQIEGVAIADQSAHLIDPGPNRYHRYGIISSPGHRRRDPKQVRRQAFLLRLNKLHLTNPGVINR